MYQAQIEVRQGEAVVLYGTVSAQAPGTVTINSATFQLLLPDHSAGVNNAAGGGTNWTSPVSVLGFDPGASVMGGTSRAWYELSAADTKLLQASVYYIARFVITFTGSDGIQRVDEPEMQVLIGW